METNNKDFKLSESEVQRLFEFATKKFVHWYDLQIEVVDHLASAIETEMQLAPGLSFESALEKVYKSFGIFGFAKLCRRDNINWRKLQRKDGGQHCGLLSTGHRSFSSY
jgi:hypothetical protein